MRLRGGDDHGHTGECQKRKAVRRSEEAWHVEGTRCENRELPRRIEPWRQEERLGQLIDEEHVESGRYQRAEEEGRRQGRKGCRQEGVGKKDCEPEDNEQEDNRQEVHWEEVLVKPQVDRQEVVLEAE